jgi:hypothetical protein
MITVQLQGGLGNQLFQLAFLDYISKKTGKEKILMTLQSPNTVHSGVQYYETIFKKWRSLLNPRGVVLVGENQTMAKQSWEFLQEIYNPICLQGYFQRYEYIDPIRNEFISKLTFDESILQKYDVSNKIAIHIRGGDYRGNVFHEFDLKSYYQKCISMCPGFDFVVFTNDVKYARGILDCEIIQEDEIDSLLLMSRCKGVICANSSFSWWGAYLNPNRPIFMPSKWFRNQNMEGNYYFNGVTVVDINV